MVIAFFDSMLSILLIGFGAAEAEAEAAAHNITAKSEHLAFIALSSEKELLSG
jgi:hypothetical protein